MNYLESNFNEGYQIAQKQYKYCSKILALKYIKHYNNIASSDYIDSLSNYIIYSVFEKNNIISKWIYHSESLWAKMFDFGIRKYVENNINTIKQQIINYIKQYERI